MKRVPIKIAISLFLFFMSNAALSQQKEYIVGKLLDAKTQEPIAFASIRIRGRALGVISNSDGSFKIPLKYKEYGDIIEISSMGYQTQEVLIYDFSVYDVNIVRLLPAVLELQEAIVSAKSKRKRRLSARQIVRKAVQAIPKNYPRNPFSVIGYYRDYQVKNNSYLNLNEAILQVFDRGFHQIDYATTDVQIFEYKVNENFKRDTLADNLYDYKNQNKIVPNALLYDYSGNEFNLLRVHDAIRNYNLNTYDFVNRLTKDLFQNHKFVRANDTPNEDEVLYTIKISKNLPDFSVHGKFYISKIDFSIHKMEYSLYHRKKREQSVRTDEQNNNNELLFEVITAYKRNNSKMYLDYISFHNDFLVRRLAEFYVREIVISKASRCFEVRFSKNIESESAGRSNNYEFKFKGKRLRFDSVVVFDDAVRLYPKLNKIETDQMFTELIAAADKGENVLKRKLLETRIEGIKGFNSNSDGAVVLLNERKKENYQQFREFFIQQVKPNTMVPDNGLFMNKRKPIFQEQPITKPENFDDYWMNTPLQNIKN